jgi:nickel superoxide dismutase
VLTPRRVVHAHCDIPCGIYDPASAEIAAQTVYNMNKKLNELGQGPGDLNWANTVARMVKVKEEHADTCKHELWVLWTDFFKPEHLDQFPDLHDVFWKTTKAVSTARRGVDMDASQALKDGVAQIKAMFQKANGAAAATVVTPVG